jgi:hypothetical protein
MIYILAVMVLSGEQLAPITTPGFKHRLEDKLLYEFILYKARTLIHQENPWSCLVLDGLGSSHAFVVRNTHTDKRKILVSARRCALMQPKQ